jgi:type II secretory pathway pseudopilin PulG
MRVAPSPRRLGFTLPETMIATGIAGVIIGAFLLSATALQRAFVSAQTYSASKRSQMRLTDYLALDLRRALTVQAPVGSSTILSVTVPDYYAADGTPRIPVINKLVADYGDPAKPVTVVYSKQGSSVFRQAGATAPVEIASNVNDFQVTIEDLNKVIKTHISFVPNFRPTSATGSRETTTLHNTIWLRNKRRT